MEKVDLVIVGAEGVVESGGIINKASVASGYIMIVACVMNGCIIPPHVNFLNLQIGTYQIAVMAKSLSKPFYVVAESFKFVRLYPLKQTDIRNTEKVRYSGCCTIDPPTCHIIMITSIQYESIDSDKNSHPYIDYTPPQYITLLFTDLGVLTPSVVSDELIKLYW